MPARVLARIRPKDLVSKAEALVLQQGNSLLPGEEKRKRAARELARWLVDQIGFGPGPIGRIGYAIAMFSAKRIAEAIVEGAYREAKARGIDL